VDKAVFDFTAVDAAVRGRLILALVVPRPIGWVGTRDPDGTHNLAPYSFFNAVSSTPPLVMFVPGLRSRVKDTLRNVRDTGEFTLSVVTDEVAEAMNVTAGAHPPEVSEFEVAGLTAVPGTHVDAPMVGEARANFECRMTDVVEVGGDPPSAAVVFGEIVAAHVDSALLDGTRIRQEDLHAVGRHAGGAYSRTHDLFWMDRPGVGP
jgi:flavin reductase (DIM6/NTAB) family NADH-FMN oxidoreductase RutF